MEKQYSGLGKWPPSAWKRLLELVLPALDELPDKYTWSLGGGTALAISYNHRVSYDIDIFFQDANALKLLSPNKNNKIRNLSDNWQQPGHYLKIERPEGDIDFLVTRTITDNPFFIYDFNGKKITIETPGEIIAKKILYRGSRITIRDIFDIAVFWKMQPEIMTSIILEIQDDIPRVADRIRLLQKRYKNTIHEAVMPTEFGKKYLEHGADIVIYALEFVTRDLELK